MQQNSLGEEKLDLDSVISIGDRCLQDCVQKQNAIVVTSQAEVVAVPEENFVVLRQIFAFDNFVVGICKKRARARKKRFKLLQRRNSIDMRNSFIFIGDLQLELFNTLEIEFFFFFFFALQCEKKGECIF